MDFLPILGEKQLLPGLQAASSVLLEEVPMIATLPTWAPPEMGAPLPIGGSSHAGI